MVSKITTPPTNNDVIDKVNEIIDNLGGFPYGESDSAADAVQKEVTISEITTLRAGQIIIVKPTITSTVADATLKLNNFTAYPMLYGTAAITTSTDSITWAANYPSWFRFDGSNWVFLGHGVDNNTTYSAMTTANGIAGTETTARLMRADRLKAIIQGTTLTGLSTSTNSAVTASDTVTTGIGKLQAQVNNAVMKSATAQQTIALSSGTGTTALGVTSKSTSSYISFSGTGGWMGSYGVSSDKKPVFYNGSGYTLAYTSDIPTNNNQLTNGAGYITSAALSGYEQTSNKVTSISSSSTDTQYPSAKCIYDIVGDIETALRTINSGGSGVNLSWYGNGDPYRYGIYINSELVLSESDGTLPTTETLIGTYNTGSEVNVSLTYETPFPKGVTGYKLYVNEVNVATATSSSSTVNYTFTLSEDTVMRLEQV